MRRADRIQLLLLLSLFVAPALAAWFAHQVWQPSVSASYGELLPPTVPQFAGITDGNGHSANLLTLQGRWVLLTVVKGECGAPCRVHLDLARQVRLAQGRDRERVVQALLQADAVAPADVAGLFCYRVPGAALDAWPDTVRTYLVDPRGRVMLRFPVAADGQRMLSDLRRLLKASRIG